MTKHLELTDDDISGMASVVLVSKGWQIGTKDGKTIYNLPGAFFEDIDLNWKEAMKAQKALEQYNQFCLATKGETDHE